MRAKEQIRLQIDGLKKQKENLPQTSYFGDDNHKPINAQIEILEGTKNASDFDGVGDSTYSAALDAEEWLNEEREENLFDSEE